MPISKSSFALAAAEANGLILCTETHDTSNGAVIKKYRAPSDHDWAYTLKENAAVIKQELVDIEFHRVTHFDGAPVLKDQTIGQFLTRLRGRYREMVDVDQAQLAWWLMRRIDAGHITDAQCAKAFGVTAVNWTRLKNTRMKLLGRAWAAALTVMGA